VSYLSEPLFELARNAIQALDPNVTIDHQYWKRGSVCFGGEPEGHFIDLADELSYEFTFGHYDVKTEAGILKMPPDPKVRKLILTLSFASDAVLETTDKEILAISEITVFDFALESYRVLSEVLAEAGLQGYLKRWGNYFPLAELSHLGALLHLPPKTVVLE
jgi:hypothetical protein